jgi:hypothetical protein
MISEHRLCSVIRLSPCRVTIKSVQIIRVKVYFDLAVTKENT